MNLAIKGLPNVVEINGSLFSIYTDFRLWMRFENEVVRMKREDKIDVSYLFKNEMPAYCTVYDLFQFSRPSSELPRGNDYSDVITIDYEIDSDYIYAAFLSQYGIDLVEVEHLHWHKFLALLKGLKDDEVMKKIMMYRNYVKTDSKKDIYMELRNAWQIERLTEEEQKEIEEILRIFDGI